MNAITDAPLTHLEGPDMDALLDAGTLEITYVGNENVYAVDKNGREYFAKDSRRIAERQREILAEYQEPPDSPLVSDETRPCPHCSGPMFYNAPTAELLGGYYCEECDHLEQAGPDEYDLADNGPTGHGELCYSDADPGL